jgi:cytochrome P450
LHYDQEYWGSVDTKEFYPLRFSPEYKRNKLAYMPFGLGPRICIGMRFALLEIKLTLIKLLKNYDIVTLRKDEKLIIKEQGVRRPAKGINCVFKRREQN